LTRLNDAAASGLSEAFSALYEAHRSGWYGPRDDTMAAASAIAAHELMPDSIGSADYFKILDALRVGDRAQAEATAKQIVLRTRQK
jgi:hypothetical protein